MALPETASQNFPEKRYIALRAAIDGARVRRAKFSGRDHLVVPVVALVGDVIIRPMGSSGPEFVPAEVLSQAPAGWNGRPVVPEHPENGTGSANTPSTLESMAFGQLFNTRFASGRLKTDAWIDVERAKALGGLAEKVVERLLANRPVEVSIGAFVRGERREGRFNGQRFTFRWDSLTPDHLAMLPEEDVGACSIDMGCGAPRAAQLDIPQSNLPAAMRETAQCMARRFFNSDSSAEQEVSMAEKKSLLGRAFDKFLEVFGGAEFRADQGMSDGEVHSLLWQALRATEPAFDGIVEVFQSDGFVIYSVSPEGRRQFLQREFAVSEGGEIELGSDSAEVAPHTRFEPLEEEEKEDSETPSGKADETEAEARAAEEGGGSEEATAEIKAAADCGCEKETRTGEEPGNREEETLMSDDTQKKVDSEATAVKPEVTAEKRELINLLIANKRAPFHEDDYNVLTSFSESKLRDLREHYTPDPTPQTMEEWLQTAPSEDAIRAFRRVEAQEVDRRTEMISALKQAQEEYTMEQLRNKPTEELEALVRILGLDKRRPDYSGRGVPFRLDEMPVEPPNPYEAGLQALREKCKN